MRASLAFGMVAIGFGVFGLAGGLTTADAQCWSCPGTPGMDNFQCVNASAGSWDCTQEYPGAPCMGRAGCPGSGGGGGGGCGGGLYAMPSQPAGKTVATAALLFKSRAALNAHLFGGRGRGPRVLAGGVLGDLTPEEAARAIAAVAAEAAGNLRLAHAYTNLNNGAKPLDWGTGIGDGYVFAAVSEGMGTHLQVRAKQGRQPSGPLADLRASESDLILVDLQIGGEAYILALKVQTLDQAAPDFAQRIKRIQGAMKEGVDRFPDIEQLDIMIMPC